MPEVLADSVVYFFSVVGFVASIITIKQYAWRRKRLTWRMVEKGVLSLKDKVVASQFMPEAIFCIGRGGAIAGALLSGCMGHVPLLCIDRSYVWVDGKSRQEKMFSDIEIGKHIDRLLLVSGEMHTGDTAEMYKMYFESKGVREIKVATLVTETYPRFVSDYSAYTVDDPDLQFPWHMNESYRRDSKRAC